MAQLADRSGLIMSPTALRKLGADFSTAPVCVGPFRFKDRVSGTEIAFTKRSAGTALSRSPELRRAFEMSIDRKDVARGHSVACYHPGPRPPAPEVSEVEP